MSISIHQLKEYNAEDERRFKERWHSTKSGRDAHAVIINLIKQGGGEDFLQYAIEDNKIDRSFLENDMELKGISIRDESIDFPPGDNIEGIDFSYAHFSDLKFTNCCLGAYGNFVTFNNCHFLRCSFHFSVWVGCSFNNCHFESVNFIQGGRFENCNFTGTKFTNFFFHDNLFDNCRFSASVEFSSQNFKPIKGDWGGLTFDKTRLVDFYLAIRDAYKEGGAHDKEWDYYYKSRHATTRHNTKGFWRKWGNLVFNEFLIGYGEKPGRSLIASLFVICLFAFLYMFSGLVFSLPGQLEIVINYDFWGNFENIRQELFLPSSYWQWFKNW